MPDAHGGVGDVNPHPTVVGAVTGAPGPDDPLAAQLRGFGPIGLLAMLVILASNLVFLLLSTLLVLAWAQRSRTPWRDLGFVRPGNWIITVAGGIVFGVAFKLAMKSIVMPLLGADPINHAYHHLVGNRGALPGMLFTVIVGAGFGEELLFRGYLFERLGRLFGSARWAKPLIVLLTSAVFAAGHIAVQGRDGALQALITGLTFGTIFAVTGRIWVLMVAHASFDVAAVAIIYWDLESRVAHFFFK
jgi:membrane protease YdiL (CAAX protease family)